jgi:sRNA-binding protein
MGRRSRVRVTGSVSDLVDASPKKYPGKSYKYGKMMDAAKKRKANKKKKKRKATPTSKEELAARQQENKTEFKEKLKNKAEREEAARLYKLEQDQALNNLGKL